MYHYKKITSKKMFSLLMVFVLIASLVLPVFAAENSTVAESDLNEKDTPHGHYFYTGPFALNQWGDIPVSGTRVTSWEKTSSDSQAWDMRGTKNGEWIITTNIRPDLALNIYRVDSQPEVNVVPYIGNYYKDCVMAQGTLRLTHQPSTSGYYNFGVTIMYDEYTTPYNLCGRICRWTANPTNWTHIA